MKELPAVLGESDDGVVAALLHQAPLQSALLEAVSDALQSAFLVYDRNDVLVFASRSAASYLGLSARSLTVGMRLREVLGAAYDAGWHHLVPGQADEQTLTRDEWLTRQVAAHWRERFEMQTCEDGKRWTRYTKRRLASGYGFCVMTDISEQKRREDQWRADVERVQLTEEILDNLAHPVFVQDRSFHVVAVNKAFCDRLSIGSEHALGSTLHALFDDVVATQIKELSQEMLAQGGSAARVLPLQARGKPQGLTRLHMQRVGKPGRYFVVASLADQAGAATETPVRSASTARDNLSREAESRAGNSVPLTGRKALVVSQSPDFEHTTLDLLGLLGVDCCCVRSDDELEAFLDVARSVSVTIDLVLIDRRSDLVGLGLIQAQEIDYLLVEEGQEPSELAFSILDRLTGLQPAPEPEDDWEISTEIGRSFEAEPQANVQPSLGGQNAEEFGFAPLILVAEDNAINQIVFSQILEGLGHTYRICANGEDVVAAWRQANPSLILMDLTLPGISGLEAARRIRAEEAGRGRHVPIIGVLANAYDRDREACHEAGMDDVILKPLSPDIIDQVIDRHARRLKAKVA
ncbi:response regulator [Peteryoungia ipomoeae]|uniref:Response regulator n=1 Tax=Peteryoungia ipomoeae TaxID=1210932 RepID=A0A4S8NZR9_9HYPH|nr:response regulator [Peteryoungia ipomoeae]THV23260.1 response regulator [Peteryoungia ipomoeae]